MSLKNPDEDVTDFIEDKKSNFDDIFKKIKIPLIILVVGILIGGLITHEYIEPLIKGNQNTQSTSCLRTNELLSKENSCLYSLLSDPNKDTSICSQTQ